MNKTVVLITLFLFGMYLTLSSYSGGALGSAGVDATGARTGSPGCNCHGSGPSTTTSVTITLDSAGYPVTHFVAGQFYHIIITGTQTSSSLSLPKFGFQLAAVNLSTAGTTSASNAGTLAVSGLPTGCANRVTSAGIRIIEHTTRLSPSSGSGGAGTIYSESIGWTAPATGSGGVKLLGVLNAINATGGADAGDKWNTAFTNITEENAPLTGVRSVCTGNTTTLACATPGGAWTSADTSIASVSSTGDVLGISAGSVAISYTTSFGSSVVNVNVITTPTGGYVVGAATVCSGATTALSDSAGTPGDTWTSGATSIATIGTSSGVVRGFAAGTAPVTYTVTNTCGTASAVGSITVLPLAVPGTITGPGTVCEAGTATLTDTTSGGTWSTGTAGVASVNGAGTVFGVSPGTASISYSVTNSCGTVSTSRSITVNPLPIAGSIGGPSIACLGAGAVALSTSGASGAGSWSSSSPSVITVNAGGVFLPLSLGTATISYTVTNGCGTAVATHAVTSTNLAFAGTITGATTNVCLGSSITLSDTIAGGTWSSSSPIASVSGGVVTGVGLGTATISYSVTNSCGTAIATKTITVSPLPFAGVIVVPSYLCVGSAMGVSATGTGGTLSLTNGHASLTGTTVTGISAGIDTLIYITTNSCGTATAIKVLPVNALPYAAAITGNTSACVGNTITLSDATPGGTWASSAPSVCSISATGQVRAVAPGQSSISYSVNNTCGNALASLLFSSMGCTAGINDEVKTPAGLTISPNPNTGAFTLNLTSPNTEPALVTITNVIGKNVSEFNIMTNRETEQSLQLPAGIYFVTAVTKNERLVSKMVIGQQ